MYKTKVINLIASPGSGKSTTAAGVFHHLKLAGMDVELVGEYAKELTWHERQDCLKCQPYIFGKQLYRIEKLLGKVKYIITDSPIILGIVYAEINGYPQCFSDFIAHEFKKMDNINFLLERTKKYNPNGRNQTEEEANEIQNKIVGILDYYKIERRIVKADNGCAGTITADILAKELLKSFENEI